MSQVIESGPAVISADVLKTSIKVEPLTCTIGAELSNVNLGVASRDSALVAEIRSLLLKYKVLFFRDQDITPEQHLSFGRRFGELHVHPSVRGKPREQWTEIMPVHADAGTARVAGDKWHTDVSCDEKPPSESVVKLWISASSHSMPASL